MGPKKSQRVCEDFEVQGVHDEYKHKGVKRSMKSSADNMDKDKYNGPILYNSWEWKKTV